MPSAAHRVGSIAVNRDGTINCEDEARLSTIKPMFIECGWLEAEVQRKMPAEPESSGDFKDMLETVETIGVQQMDIAMPIPGWTIAQKTTF